MEAKQINLAQIGIVTSTSERMRHEWPLRGYGIWLIVVFVCAVARLGARDLAVSNFLGRPPLLQRFGAREYCFYSTSALGSSPTESIRHRTEFALIEWLYLPSLACSLNSKPGWAVLLGNAPAPRRRRGGSVKERGGQRGEAKEAFQGDLEINVTPNADPRLRSIIGQMGTYQYRTPESLNRPSP
ncbi:hypothetical protein QAD02_002412 [Eretmocerus hayati]|uniref:Uncharacterized protein n=1 Tax=Eretmocerus hayati TaxID=131215 RepID=A0ACC2NIZ2_9HYME|nr:hypothetical protein QAD02_002412 [Eretmocerus hayati]